MIKNRTDKPVDDSAYELLVAEEELILHAQMLIQRVLNERGISQKRLAEKLGVGESYVSQMLGTSARNLTLRTIARVMKALNVKATLVLDDYVETTIAASASNDDDAKAMVSRMASARFSTVWGDLVELEPRKKAGRRRDGDAAAYASFEPDVQEMALAA
jgi:transcriptional regulator with XRE-family HTH domain